MNKEHQQRVEELRAEMKARFIKQLASFLCDNQAGKSIMLEVEQGRPEGYPLPSLAKEWATLLNASPLRGYITVDEAEKFLTEFLK